MGGFLHDIPAPREKPIATDLASGACFGLPNFRRRIGPFLAIPEEYTCIVNDQYFSPSPCRPVQEVPACRKASLGACFSISVVERSPNIKERTSRASLKDSYELFPSFLERR